MLPATPPLRYRMGQYNGGTVGFHPSPLQGQEQIAAETAKGNHPVEDKRQETKDKTDKEQDDQEESPLHITPVVGPALRPPPPAPRRAAPPRGPSCNLPPPLKEKRKKPQPIACGTEAHLL